jgi:hypothetical protein
VIRCGAARADITPAPGVPLAGYPFVHRQCRGAHDPLYASVAVYDDGGRVAVVAALDLLAVGPSLSRTVRAAAAERHGIDSDGVLLCATHTHSAPALRLGPAADPAVYGASVDAYETMVASRVSDALDAAMRGRREAVLSIGHARAEGVTANRRRPGGATDERVAVVCARDRGGAPIAHLVSFGCHPTVLQADNDLASSDFPGATRAHVERYRGGAVVYATGAAGDQSTRFRRRGTTFDEVQRLGRIVGEAALQAIDAAAPIEAADVRSRRRSVAVPLRRLPSPDDAAAALRRAEARLSDLRAAGAPAAEVRTAEVLVLGARHDARLSAMNGTRPAQVMSEIQVLVLGDLRIAGLPVEWFAEDGLRLRDAPFPVVVVAYANDMLGYAPPAAAYREGGYEPSATLLAAEARDILMRETVSLMRDT